MADRASTEYSDFEPFPEVAGIGWSTAFTVALCGAAASGLLSMFLVHPLYVEGATTADIRAVSTTGLVAAAIAIVLALWMRRWNLPDARLAIRVSAGATALLGIAVWFAPTTDWQLLFIVATAVWVPGLVHHRPYLLSRYAPIGHFRVLGMYWTGIALGASAPLWLAGFASARWESGMLAVGSAALMATLLSLRLTEREEVPAGGIGSHRVGWARRSTYFAAATGALFIVGISELLAVMADTWNINQNGRISVLGAGALVVAATLLFGHWYHRMSDASLERHTDVAALATVIGSGLIIAAIYSHTLIGLVVALIAAIGALGFATVLIDRAGLSPLTDAARRAATADQLVWFVLGGVVASLIAAGPLDDWTPRALITLTTVPLLGAAAAVGWGARKNDVTHSDAVRTAEIERTAVQARSLLTMRSVDVAYGTVQVLFDLDFEIVDSEIVAVMGTNGAGKTTLLRTIAGLEQPTRGRIVVGGADVTEFESTWMTELGVCHIAGPESIAPTLTVEENLTMFAHTLGRSGGTAERIEESFELFPRLGERRNQRASTLSGGEKQMLALSKAVIQRPRILLIDEFSLGLAPKIVADLLPTVREINRRGTAVVIVEQNVATSLSIADRAYVIEKGEMLWFGNAQKLRDDATLIERMYLEGASHGGEA